MFGEYCDAEVQVMAKYLTPESIYLDIGTNIGYHALAINQQVGCSVLAFEPHPNHFSVAAYNCKDKPIRIYNTALGSKNGTMTIWLVKEATTLTTMLKPLKQLLKIILL
jgi:FkbM family methyltransferase